MGLMYLIRRPSINSKLRNAGSEISGFIVLKNLESNENKLFKNSRTKNDSVKCSGNDF